MHWATVKLAAVIVHLPTFKLNLERPISSELYIFFLNYAHCKIGATIDSFVGFSIAGHKMQIVQVDGGSWIQPYEVDYVLVHAGILEIESLY